MKNLLSSISILLLSLSSFAQVVSTKNCDSLKIISLEYPVSDTEIDNFSSGSKKDLIKINLESSSKITKQESISYPVWSILNDHGDTLGKNYAYTYTFFFDANHNNLIPRSKLVVDSQFLAQQGKVYIHLHDGFQNENSTFACIIPFDQIALGGILNEKSNDETSHFYPNPATSILYLKGQSEKTDIIDQNGKSLFSGLHVTEIDLSQIPKGIYTLKTQAKDASIHFEKLIVE